MLINRFNKQLFLIFQVFVLIELILPTFAIAQLSTDSKRIINFGFAEDAYPISALATQSRTMLDNDTLCYQLYEHLKNKFAQYKFETILIDDIHRFKSEKDLDINCDSNSVTEQRKKNLQSEGATFSIKYFTTSSRYILRKSQQHLQTKLEKKQKLPKGNKIAVKEGTTQYESLIKYDYHPKNHLQTFKNREGLYEQLITNQEIVAYITDEIVLKGLLTKVDNLSTEYQVIEKYPWQETEKLAIIVYNAKSNIELLYEINEWIDDSGRKWITEKNDELDRELTNTLNKKDSNKTEVSKPTKKDINIYIYFYVGTVIILLTFLIFLLIKIKSSSIIINNHSGGGDNVGNNKNIEN